ncbi:hypothetical protein Tco_0271099 [Tanacetum coccineum]
MISEETIRADLLFDDAHGVDCFPKQVIWDSLRDIGYEGNLAQLTFSKPLFSPQWKYLVHVLLHCLSPKSTSWEQFGTNIASALVGLATNQKFNFSLMIMNGMLGHISNGTPFLMYPRFIQLFLNKQLEGAYTLDSTYVKEVITAIGREEDHSTVLFWAASSARGCSRSYPLTQCAAQDRFQYCTAQRYAGTQDASQTSGGDEGLLDLYALTRECPPNITLFAVELRNSQKAFEEREEEAKEAKDDKCFFSQIGEE